jgi:hypothetical protein
MIGLPFNDLGCLGAITEIVVGMVTDGDPVIVELAAKYPTTAELVEWIRGLPQLDDNGDAATDDQVKQCKPAQRLRLPAEDPNCVERSAMYLAIAELIDPAQSRQLATLDTPMGLHTFPIENGIPVILDPLMPRNCITCGLAAASVDPVAVDAHDAMEWVAHLAGDAPQTRNGPARVHRARNAMMMVPQGQAPDAAAVEDLGWMFAVASEQARRYGVRALGIVQSAAQAIADLIEDINARRAPRNVSFSSLYIPIGGGRRLKPTPWAAGLAVASARIGGKVGGAALRVKLASMGVDPATLAAMEQELNREGLTMGPIAPPQPTVAALPFSAAPAATVSNCTQTNPAHNAYIKPALKPRAA